MSGKRAKDGRVYYSPRVYLPTKLTSDSAFPFKTEGYVYVKIRRGRLIIQKATKKTLEKCGVSGQAEGMDPSSTKLPHPREVSSP